MGWRFWRSEEPAEPVQGVRDYDVTVIDRPASTSPGSPLPCLNEGDPVRVGERVTLTTTFTFQPTTIRSITVAGVGSDVLDTDQLGDVVLGDEADLAEVYRSSSLIGPDEEAGGWPEGSFVMQVQRAEPRGDDALVFGRVAVGTTLRPGTHVTCSTSAREDTPYPEVLAVEPGGEGEVGLLLADVAAARFQFGDEVVHVELPQGLR